MTENEKMRAGKIYDLSATTILKNSANKRIFGHIKKINSDVTKNDGFFNELSFPFTDKTTP